MRLPLLNEHLSFCIEHNDLRHQIIAALRLGAAHKGAAGRHAVAVVYIQNFHASRSFSIAYVYFTDNSPIFQANLFFDNASSAYYHR